MLGWRALAFCVACLCSPAPGAGLETIHSDGLKRDVPVAVHVPAAAAVAQWTALHPTTRMKLVLFLPGAFDGPGDFIKEGLEAFLCDQETKGMLPPSLWVAVTHFRGWYADRAVGSFPYERFLMEELIPRLEARYPAYGGSPQARSVAGLSMGGFGALNLSARTGAGLEGLRQALAEAAILKNPMANQQYRVAEA